MSTQPRTRKYKLIHGGHRNGKKFLEEGSVLELTPRQARALVNKVAPVESVAAQGTKAPKPPKAPKTPSTPEGGEGGEGEGDGDDFISGF